jgi:hypothetical protein
LSINLVTGAKVTDADAHVVAARLAADGCAVITSLANGQVRFSDASFAAPRTVTTMSAGGKIVAATSDLSWIVISDGASVRAVRTASGQSTPLNAPAASDSTAYWGFSSDGNWLLYRTNLALIQLTSSVGDLWAIPIAGGAPHLVAKEVHRITPAGDSRAIVSQLDAGQTNRPPLVVDFATNAAPKPLPWNSWTVYDDKLLVIDGGLRQRDLP